MLNYISTDSLVHLAIVVSLAVVTVVSLFLRHATASDKAQRIDNAQQRAESAQLHREKTVLIEHQEGED